MAHILLVEPSYYTRYPPLGLLKLAAYHKLLGDTVELVKGCRPAHERPDRIFVTSLFTYAWHPVHQAVAFYRTLYPSVSITIGGIYATLMKQHAELTGAEVYSGLNEEVEGVLPDYSFVPEFKASILFSSRGCIRRCPFCAAPILEPYDPRITGLQSISHLIYPGHKKVIFWDNNFFANPHWLDIVLELKEKSLKVDFNQGLDARLITWEVSEELKGLKIEPIRLAYDTNGQRESVRKAISLLKEAGFSERQMIIYLIYNFDETPQEFLSRLQDILEWGAVGYPMRYEPINTYGVDGNPLAKNMFISQHWSAELLEMLARARRVIGYGGAFPPHEGLRKKICNASTFEQAFALREPYPTSLKKQLRKALGPGVYRLPIMP